MTNLNASQWRDFLLELSRVILLKDIPENEDVNRPNFPPEVRAAGYIGFEGASEAQLLAAEARLGVTLPPSYRTFLSVSNGWPVMWDSVQPGELWPTDKIRWVREQDPELVEIYGQYGHDVSAEEHLRLQSTGSWSYRGQYVGNLLSISDHGDACDLLLCPEVVAGNGNWECWDVSSWGGVGRWPDIEGWFQMVYEFHSQNQ